MPTKNQKQEFFAVMDRGNTIRGAAIQAGVSPSTAYGWVSQAGLAAKRASPRTYTPEDKAEFFGLLAEQGNVSAVARELGFVRVTCYKWAHQAGIFTGKDHDAQREKYLQFRAEGMTRNEASKQAGVDKRTGHDWDKGIRKFYGGRVYPDGRVVTYPEAERLAQVKQPRRTYITPDKVDLERLERPIDSRFLSLQEREKIGDLLSRGYSMRRIAAELGRAPSTISREVARNTTTGLGYMPHGAHRKAAQRRTRPRACKLHEPGLLRSYVKARLVKRWSPEQISHRMVKDFATDLVMRACTETIYQAIYEPGPGSFTGKEPSTRSGRKKRKSRQQPGRRKKRFADPMVPLSQRPAEAEGREVPGHWEGDLVVGTQNRSAIGTLVDRASRYLLIVHLVGDHTAEVVGAGLTKSMAALPVGLGRTLTWDQGAEMANHARFTAETGIPVYFCDPHSPWQRGTNENTNGLIRQYLPKGTSLTRYTPSDLGSIADELNNRPRKSLGWDTPSERLASLLASA